MQLKAMRLPWRGKRSPRAMLDVIRECNISCRSCYNKKTTWKKSLTDMVKELDFLQSRRSLSAVTLIGGEVLLHPDLCAMVREIKRRGIVAELCTNGLLIDERSLSELKNAGVDIIYLHMERSQQRSDLCENPTILDLVNLCRSKAALIAGYGIDVGLTFTAYRDTLSDLHELVQLSIESPHINFLLMTCYRDHSCISTIRGDIDSGLQATRKDSSSGDSCSRLSAHDVGLLLKNEFNLEPFGFIGSNIDDADPRWLSFLVGTVRDANGGFISACVRPSLFENFLMGLSLAFTGKYPAYLRQNQTGFRLQLLGNALSGGNIKNNVLLLLKSLRPGAVLCAKRLLIQNPAEILPDGQVIHCLDCPDAVTKNNRLVPVCICDFIDTDQ